MWRRSSRDLKLLIVLVLVYTPTLSNLLTEVVNSIFQLNQPSSHTNDDTNSIKMTISTAGVSRLVCSTPANGSLRANVHSHNLCVRVCVLVTSRRQAAIISALPQPPVHWVHLPQKRFETHFAFQTILTTLPDSDQAAQVLLTNDIINNQGAEG